MSNQHNYTFSRKAERYSFYYKSRHYENKTTYETANIIGYSVDPLYRRLRRGMDMQTAINDLLKICKPREQPKDLFRWFCYERGHMV